MKKNLTPHARGGDMSVLPYQAPDIEALDIAVEKGFATTKGESWDYDPIVDDEYNMDDIYGSY